MPIKQKRVTLTEVTADNWEAVADLELADAQRDLVASNAYSLAESKYDPHARPRAIYAGKRVVGFLMYEVRKAQDKSRKALIYRFMIDKRYQSKGYGREALAQALEEIKAVPRMRRVRIQYAAENPVAKSFYGSFGFVEIGRDEDDEIVAELKV